MHKKIPKLFPHWIHVWKTTRGNGMNIKYTGKKNGLWDQVGLGVTSNMTITARHRKQMFVS